VSIVLTLALTSVVLQVLIYVLLKRWHKEVYISFFGRAFHKSEIEHLSRTMMFYYNPVNWRVVSILLQLLLSANFLIFVFILYKFFVA